MRRHDDSDDEQQRRVRFSLTSIVGIVMVVGGGLWLGLAFDPVGIEGNPPDNPVWAYGAVLIGLMLAAVGIVDS